jgi:hypothetical protein
MNHYITSSSMLPVSDIFPVFSKIAYVIVEYDNTDSRRLFLWIMKRFKEHNDVEVSPRPLSKITKKAPAGSGTRQTSAF